MKNLLFFLLLMLCLSACTKSGQKQYAKCNSRQGRKKVAYYLSIPHQ